MKARTEDLKILITICVIIYFHHASGQSISARSNGTQVRNGGSVDFELIGYNRTDSMTSLSITGGFFLPGQLDIVVLTVFNVPLSKLELFQQFSVAAPSFLGRVSIPSPHVMRISNFTFNEEGYGFAFSMSYSDIVTRTATSQIFKMQVGDFYGVSVDVTSNITVAEGQSIPSVSCTAAGVPAPSIQWFKDDVLLSASSSLHITYEESLQQTLNRSTLSFQNGDLKHAGLYSCLAHNFIANATQSFEIIIKSAPGNISLSISCHELSQRICWQLKEDTIHSQADEYHVTSSDGWNQVYQATTKCLPLLDVKNTSSNFNLTVVASNQYGSSPATTTAIHLTDICSGTVTLTWSNLTLSLFLLLAFACLCL